MTTVMCTIEEKTGGVELSFVTTCSKSHTAFEDRLAKKAIRSLKISLGMDHISYQLEKMNKKREVK